MPWLGRRVPLAGGGRGPNRLSLISRWKIVDNLRRTLLPPTLLGFLLLAWVAFPGAPVVWTALGVLVLATPLLTEAMGGLLSAHRVSALPPAVRGVTLRLRPASALWILHVAFLPHRAVVLGDAILRTLVRLRRRRRLLEWTSAARVARVLVGTESRRPFWREMFAAPLAATRHAGAARDLSTGGAARPRFRSRSSGSSPPRSPPSSAGHGAGARRR